MSKTRDRVKNEISSGQVQLMLGDARALDIADDSVDKIVHMNVCYFFDPLDATLRELKRVLKPGGVRYII